MVEHLTPEREVQNTAESYQGFQFQKFKKWQSIFQLSEVNKPEGWLSSEWMLCEQLPCSNGELNGLGPPTQDPH